MALGTQFSIGAEPAMARWQRVGGAISLKPTPFRAGLRASAGFGRITADSAAFRTCCIHGLHLA